MIPKKAMTWGELKEFANQLPESEMEKPLTVWGEERGFKINSASQLGEDFIVTDYYCEPVSSFDEEELEEYKDNDRISSGTPILWIDEYEDDFEGEKEGEDEAIPNA